jgi:methanogenic corrinoid protein MtbC1
LFGVTVDYLLGRKDNSEALNASINNENINHESIDEYYKIFLSYLLNGYREAARILINSLHEQGINITAIYFNMLQKALKEVGVLWEKGSLDVGKEHVISEAVRDRKIVIKLKEKKTKDKGYSMLALTSGPEMHNIGLRMITDMLEIHGWDVIYLGSNVPVMSLITAIEIEEPDVVAVSVTLPYHMESAKHLIAAVKNHFGEKAPKIIVGGGAFTNCKDVCKETGADYYGKGVEDIIAIFEKQVK